ncbi:TetR family transcriptional regulator [Microbacterium sp. kSW2-24]|uniref:TetR/AcrR family transcriptional regulator n=1 Tax=Microbacterium galbinum TaxID=2851646 RepID=UPI001FFCCD06|nr:TetR/AcrR family transcriptional regulator [Microbacterium galbinum]MCK2023344.1 TetR family transcriptional regulator [Microbacterium galbinum]
MPKNVDHDARRADIVRAVWRLIARDGIEAASMRRMAEELGFANGALAGYFPHKRAILAAAFRHVYTATNDRYEVDRQRGLRGLPALRAFLLQVFPLDEERLLEARIAIPFMEHAAHDAEMRELYVELMAGWQRELRVLLHEAIDEGDAAPDLDIDVVVAHLIGVSQGVQASRVLNPDDTSPAVLRGMIELLLRSVR